MRMRQVRIETLCDYCRNQEHPEDTEATDSIAFIAYPSRTVMRYDHCAKHNNPMWFDLLALANEDLDAQTPTMPTPRRRKEETPRPCPFCDFVARSGGGLNAHLAGKHPDQYEAPQPTTERGDYELSEVLTRDVDGPPFHCPECGQPRSSRTALGVHRSKAHGYLKPPGVK
jgi:uncharacterized C2H2 Zn-finger protein